MFSATSRSHPGVIGASILSALLFQLIARQQLADVFDVGLELVRVAAVAAQYNTIMTVAHGLLSLQPLEPIKATLLIDLGTSYRRLGQTTAARNMYSMGQVVAEAAQIRQEHARALHGLSACSLEDKDYLKASQEAKLATALYQQGEPLYWLAQQNLGIAYLHTNRPSEGMDILERCSLFWELQHNTDAKLSVLEEMVGQ